MQKVKVIDQVRINFWLWNDAQSLMQHKRPALLFSSSSIRFPGHKAQQIVDFDTHWAFPDCNLSFDLPMALKWYTKLEVA